MAKAKLLSLLPFLKEKDEEEEDLEIFIRKNGFAYSLKIKGKNYQRKIFDISSSTRAPKAYFGYLLLNLAESYGLNGSSGIFILKDAEAKKLVKRILFAKLDGKKKRKEVLGLIKEFRALTFKRKVGILVPSESSPSRETPRKVLSEERILGGIKNARKKQGKG